MTVHTERWHKSAKLNSIGLDGTYGKRCQGRVFVLKMFSRDPRVQLASLEPRETIGLHVRALGSQPLRSFAMFTQCRMHALFSLRERRTRFISRGYTLPYLVNPLSLLEVP